MEYDGYQAEGGGSYARLTPVRAERLMHLAGAAVSVGLIAGAVLWGYRIAVRDVSGVPVVRALEGPFRTAPTNPGGEQADHQGLSVNSVAAAGLAAPVPEQLVLAPRPVDLTLEDGPGLAAAPPRTADPAPAATTLAEPAPPGSGDTAGANVLALVEAMTENPVASGGSSAAAPTPVDREMLVEAALSEALGLPDTTPAAAQSDAIAPEATFQSIPDLAGIRPVPRPGSETVLSSNEAAAPSALDAAEIDPATLKSGTRLVQLGAFDDVETARAEWLRLSATFGAEMAGKTRVVQEAESGGRTFIRLRAQGFEDEDAARDFCSKLVSLDAECIPVVVQ